MHTYREINMYRRKNRIAPNERREKSVRTACSASVNRTHCYSIQYYRTVNTLHIAVCRRKNQNKQNSEKHYYILYRFSFVVSFWFFFVIFSHIRYMCCSQDTHTHTHSHTKGVCIKLCDFASN